MQQTAPAETPPKCPTMHFAWARSVARNQTSPQKLTDFAHSCLLIVSVFRIFVVISKLLRSSKYLLIRINHQPHQLL